MHSSSPQLLSTGFRTAVHEVLAGTQSGSWPAWACAYLWNFVCSKHRLTQDHITDYEKYNYIIFQG